MLVKVFIATSLDGFIARENGELDWLLNASQEPDDHGYAAFMASIDLIIMGRNTFEKLLSFGIDWPFQQDVVVLSRSLTPQQLPDSLPNTIRLMQGPIFDVIAQLRAEGYQQAYLDGGQLIQQALCEQLVDEMIITRIPVLIGDGIALFGSLPGDVKLQHLHTKAYPSGFVQSHYQIQK